MSVTSVSSTAPIAVSTHVPTAGSLELVWSAHESSVWSDDDVNHKTMRAALRDHQRLFDAIRDGNAPRAERLARDHLGAARRNTLAAGADKTIEAKLISRSAGQ